MSVSRKQPSLAQTATMRVIALVIALSLARQPEAKVVAIVARKVTSPRNAPSLPTWTTWSARIAARVSLGRFPSLYLFC